MRASWVGTVVAVLAAAAAVGAAGAAKGSGPGCSGFVTGEDYNTIVSIGGCRNPVSEVDLTFPNAVVLSSTFTLNGNGFSHASKVPQRHVAASEAFKFATPLPPGVEKRLDHGKFFSSWFQVSLQPSLPADQRVQVTAVGIDGTRQHFYVSVSAFPNGA